MNICVLEMSLSAAKKYSNSDVYQTRRWTNLKKKKKKLSLLFQTRSACLVPACPHFTRLLKVTC